MFLDQRAQAWETSHAGSALSKFCWEGQGASLGFLIIKMFSSQMFLNWKKKKSCDRSNKKAKGRTAGIWWSDMTSVWVHKHISSSWTKGQTPRDITHWQKVVAVILQEKRYPRESEIPGICLMLWAALCCCHVLSKGPREQNLVPSLL